MTDAALRLLRARLGTRDEPVVGGLPDEPKLDVPLMPGSEILGSIVHRQPPMVSVYIDADASAEEMLAFYEREYATRGWRSQMPNKRRMRRSGFIGATDQPVTRRAFCRSETEPYYELRISPEEPRIRLSWYAVSRGMVHPCSSGRPDEPMHGPPHDAMPALEGPPGVPVRGGGGGGGPAEWSTYGSALTSMPPHDLMEHFVTSIAAQGHELIQRGAGEGVATSRWRVKRPGWEGLLVIAEQRPDVRHLLFLCFSEAAQEDLHGGWSSYSAMGRVGP